MQLCSCHLLHRSVRARCFCPADCSEERTGSLAPGKLADLVVLSRDILADEERSTITEAKVLMTVVGRKIVYEAAP